jgi:YjbR
MPRAAPRIPPKILAKLRRICLALPEAYEEQAWVGTRWMIRKRNFAHVVKIEGGWPPAYARAAASDGPLVVVTFRASAMLRDTLRDAAPHFFVPAWGTRWGTKVVGIKLGADADWGEIKTLLVESYGVLAPQKLK